jgi:hypothetical protein
MALSGPLLSPPRQERSIDEFFLGSSTPSLAAPSSAKAVLRGRLLKELAAHYRVLAQSS